MNYLVVYNFNKVQIVKQIIAKRFFSSQLILTS